MLREFEKAYIETYSAWEKYRKLIGYIAIGGVVISFLITIFHLISGYISLLVVIIGLISFGVFARRKDYNDIRKQSNKNKKEFKYYDYKRAKLDELKTKIITLLKKNNMYNKESLEIIIHSFERETTKYDKISIAISIISIFLALVGLKLQVLAVMIVVLFAVLISLLIPLAFELVLKYILVNKVKYEELVNALVEIELELTQTRKYNKKNGSIAKNKNDDT